jgi:hypothetical protein
MDESPCANDAPPSPIWAQAALTAGVGVVAGILLGRKGVTKIAAGMAAVAGAKLLQNACCDDDPAASDDSSAVNRVLAPAEVLPPEDPQKVEIPTHEAPSSDWIDHDAVQFSHLVPDTTFAAEMLKPKELPLLDDEGLPVDHVSVQPAYPRPPDKDVEEGPLIWEPGRFIQSHCNGTSTTVWFGLHDVMPPAGNPASDPVKDAASAEKIASVETPALETPPSPAQHAAAPITTPKHTTRTALPQPRQTAAHVQDATQLPPGLRLAAPGIPAVHHTQRVSQSRSSNSHRQLEPHAPTGVPAPTRQWPLMVLLSVLVAIAIVLVIDRWTNGVLFQKLGASQWSQQHETTDSPSDPPSSASHDPTTPRAVAPVTHNP